MTTDDPEPKDEATRQRFRNQRRADTKPELALRRELHRRGLRYRVDHRPTRSIRSRGDIVFTRARVVVFVDGCFWHGCPEHSTAPKNNADWWQQKLDANKERDARNTAVLESEGWHVLRIWEHEDPREVAACIERTVRAPRSE